MPENNPKIPFLIQGGTVTFMGSTLQTNGFLHGSRGARMDASGNIEINNGTFRGDFQVGGFQKTIDNTSDIQTALTTVSSQGGGTLYLKDGTYTLTADITIPAGVTLAGVNRDQCIIDGAATYGISIQGATVYSTGTVSVSNGSKTVTGAGGASWTTDMIGDYIWLGSLGDYGWYLITDVPAATTITLDVEFKQKTIAGATYDISTVIDHVTVSNLTVTDCPTGVKIYRASEIIMDDIVVDTCSTYGIDMLEVQYPKIMATLTASPVNWNAVQVSGFEVIFTDFGNATNQNIIFDHVGNSTFLDSTIESSKNSHGLQMTSCSNIAFFSVSIQNNNLDGIAMTSCSGIQLNSLAILNNGNNGIRYVSSCLNNIVYGNTIANNTQYGMRLLNSVNNLNLTSINQFYSNTSGQYSSVAAGGSSSCIGRGNLNVTDFG